MIHRTRKSSDFSLTIFLTTLTVALTAQVVVSEEPVAGTWVAVGYGGRRLVSTDGKTWEQTAQWVENGGDDDNLLRGLTYGNGKFVAVGGSKTAPIVSSEDGRTWKEQRLTGGWLGDVAYGNGTFVTVGGGGRRLRSQDGMTWIDEGRTKELQPGFPRHYRQIVFGNGTFVAVGDKGRRTLTKDGITWTHDAPPNDQLDRQHIAFGGGRFVIVGPNGYRTSSVDGQTWEAEQSAGEEPLQSVLWTGDRFWALGRRIAFSSPDGKKWERHEAKNIPGRVAQGGSRFVGFSWKCNRFTSHDLLTWERTGSDDGNAITSIYYLPKRP